MSASVSYSGWLGRLAAAAPDQSRRQKSMILVWLNGGPATMDLWDVKEGHPNAGPVRAIRTTAPQMRLSQYLPRLAQQAQHFALLRNMSTREGDHSRATYLMRTGYLPLGALQYPSVGAIVSAEVGQPTLELPNFISIAPQRFFNLDAFGPGFLGPQHAPLIVAEGSGNGGTEFASIDQALKVKHISRPKELSAQRDADRRELLRLAQESFQQSHPSELSASHATAYDRASRLMTDEANLLFNLSQEPTAVREKYGKHLFGQGCLLARRLVERGVAFVEVNHGFWDTHNDNFKQVERMAGPLDQGLAALVEDLHQRGLLKSTLIVCMGEFGRTPKINAQNGRDHYPNAWGLWLAGGGVQGGRVIGATTPDGSQVEGRPTRTMDLMATICQSLGIDSAKQNQSNLGRPIRIVDADASVVSELF